jgi:hypothetical protein
LFKNLTIVDRSRKYGHEVLLILEEKRSTIKKQNYQGKTRENRVPRAGLEPAQWNTTEGL